MDSTNEQNTDTIKHSMELRHIVLDFKSKRPERKSGAFYQNEYRERLKSDPQKWDDFKQRQKEYMKAYLSNMTDTERQARREKKSQRQRELRWQKKEAKEREQCQPCLEKQPPKKKTRKVVQESRTYWRERKRIQRASMTTEERAAVNKRENERRKEKRLASLPLPPSASGLMTTPHCTLSSYLQPLASSTPCVDLNQGSTSDSVTSTVWNITKESTLPVPVPCTPSPTKCAKYKALSRVKKVLPKARSSKLYIMKQLLKSCSPRSRKCLVDIVKSCEGESVPQTAKVQKKRQRKDTLIKQQIVSFYDHVAVSIPDKRFYSKRLKAQRKVLDRPIAQIYSEFLKAHPTQKVSKRNFFKCRPKNILKMKSMKLRQCLCETCENMQLMFEPLHAAGSPYKYATDAMKFTLCQYNGDWASLDCIERKCNKCGIQSLQTELIAKCDVTAPVTYKYWDHVADEKCKGKKTKLVTKDCSFDELISNFLSHMEMFSLHKFTDKWQRDQFNLLKKSLPSDCILMVLDFAENYTCHYQNQAQSAYYGLDQVTIHPVVIYTHCPQCLKKQTRYRIYISDDLKHDAHFVNHVLNDALQSLDSNANFYIFSDNCCSQYKSRLPVFYHRQLAKKYRLERCFFGERHGKSECDSSGGVVKSFLSQSVASGRATLTNAQGIFEYLSCNFQLSDNCSHCSTSRTFHLVKSGSVDRSVTTADIPLVKGIKKVHSFKFLFDGTLATRQLSCFCAHCLSGSHETCTSANIPSFKRTSWLKKSMIGTKRRNGEDHNIAEGDVHGEDQNANVVDGEIHGKEDFAFSEVAEDANIVVHGTDNVACREVCEEKNITITGGESHQNVHCGEVDGKADTTDGVYHGEEFSCCEDGEDRNIADNDVSGDIPSSREVGEEKKLADKDYVTCLEVCEEENTSGGDGHQNVHCGEVDENEKAVIADGGYHAEEFLNCEDGEDRNIADNDVCGEVSSSHEVGEERNMPDKDYVHGEDLAHFEIHENANIADTDAHEGINYDSFKVKIHDYCAQNDAPKKHARRKLFSDPLFNSGQDLFRDFYRALERCTSFNNMQKLCMEQSFEPLSVKPQQLKLNLDFEAMRLAPPNTPHGYLPNITIGDGNCVPRSLSTLIFGTEKCHMEIRCRIIHELIMNKSLYLDKDFLSEGSQIDRNSIIPKMVTLSDALHGIHLCDVERVFEAEVFNTRLLGTYLGPWHLHAAANLLKCGIISLYPQLGPPQNRELMARAFVPLSFHYKDPLYILWTSSRKDMKKEHWVANHVVPLVKMFK